MIIKGTKVKDREGRIGTVTAGPRGLSPQEVTMYKEILGTETPADTQIVLVQFTYEPPEVYHLGFATRRIQDLQEVE